LGPGPIQKAMEDQWYGGFLLSLIGLMLTPSKSREINDGPKTAQVD
jgi:hypothetical protein